MAATSGLLRGVLWRRRLGSRHGRQSSLSPFCCLVGLNESCAGRRGEISRPCPSPGQGHAADPAALAKEAHPLYRNLCCKPVKAWMTRDERPTGDAGASSAWLQAVAPTL